MIIGGWICVAITRTAMMSNIAFSAGRIRRSDCGRLSGNRVAATVNVQILIPNSGAEDGRLRGHGCSSFRSSIIHARIADDNPPRTPASRVRGAVRAEHRFGDAASAAQHERMHARAFLKPPDELAARA